MKFRPCIDIHNGKVKQIVGATLSDQAGAAEENFVSEQDAAYYAGLYRNHHLSGGHIILLDPEGTGGYERDVAQARLALAAFPGGLQIGGGIHAGNAERFLRLGATHVIVTSYVFQDGIIRYPNLERLVRAVGRERIVLDLSCRRRDGGYYIATDRWQKLSDVRLTEELLEELSAYCDEFLIHAVDVEGRASGIETELVEMLGSYDGVPVTYAGGIASLHDIEQIREFGKGRVDFTIGSALDLFGGQIPFFRVAEIQNKTEQE